MYGFTRKYASRNVGYQIKFDQSRSKADLGISYIPIEQTVKEHFQQILDDGLLGKAPGGIWKKIEKPNALDPHIWWHRQAEDL